MTEEEPTPTKPGRKKRKGYIRERHTLRVVYRKGCRGTYMRHEYYGKIGINGKAYERYFGTRRAAEEWCREMIRKYGE